MRTQMRCPAFYVLPDGTYSLDEDYTAVTLIMGQNVQMDGNTLLPNGHLELRAGFNWDGPSGPAINTANTLIPSAMHDCLYGFIKADLLSEKEFRKPSDKSYRDSLKTWGVKGWRRYTHFQGVDWFGWLHL